MNNDISPETRIYKGKKVYKWDDSPGLEHHCGVCATPLHNARAKTTCLGKHVEPCYRYHQQLHFVGKSHECFGCNTSDEMHHSRHKEILRIVRQIAAIEQGDDLPFSTIASIEGSARKGSTNTPTDASSEAPSVDDMSLTHKKRKRNRKQDSKNQRKKSPVEVFSTEDVDFISEAIHLTKHESKGAWAGTYDYREQSHDRKLIASVGGEEDADADETDVDEVADQLEEFSVKPISTMTPRQRKNLTKFTTPLGPNNFRKGSRKYDHGLISDIFDGVDPQIFFRLGVEVANPTNTSKQRKELVAKLVAAVKEDLDIINREASETATREAGFWQWAGKNAFDTISRTRQNFDWATGQKIGPMRDGGNLGRLEEDETENGDLGNLTDLEEANEETTKAAKSNNRILGPVIPEQLTLAKNLRRMDTPKKETKLMVKNGVPSVVTPSPGRPFSNVENEIPVFNVVEWTEVKSGKAKNEAHRIPVIKVTDSSETKSPKMAKSSLPEVTKSTTKIELQILQESSDDEGEWEVVKKGKGAAKAIPAPTLKAVSASKSAFHLPGNRSTINLK